MRKTLLITVAVIAAACGSSPKKDETTPPATPPVAETPPAPETPPATPPAPVAPPAEVKPPEPPEPQVAGPTIYKLVTENETGRMFEVTFKPGEEIGVHKHPDHVVYALTAGKLHIAPTTGDAQDVDVKPGMTLFIPAQAHSAKNTGTTEVKLVVLELRKKGTAAPAGKDAVAAAKTVYKKVFEDEHVRVLEVNLKKGQKTAPHAHPDHFAYVITGGKMAMTGADGKPQEMAMEAGQGFFLPAQVHSGKNTGKGPLKAVIFEVKP